MLKRSLSENVTLLQSHAPLLPPSRMYVSGILHASASSSPEAFAVADPEFPVGGVNPLGGMELRCRCFLMKMGAKMKELGPVGGMCWAHPLDLPMIRVVGIKVRVALDEIGSSSRSSFGSRSSSDPRSGSCSRSDFFPFQVLVPDPVPDLIPDALPIQFLF